jgi:hypothetical protein
MQVQAAQRVSSRLTTGRLEGISVPDLLWSLCTARATGVLHVTAKGITKRVFFEDGRIVFAASSDPNDRLGEQLLRQGTVRLEHLERAVARLPEGKRLGTILVEAGHLAPENLIRAVVEQVRGIVLSLFGWEEGDYALDEGPLPSEELVTLNVRTGSILLQGIRAIRSFSRIRRSVGSPRARFRASEGWREIAADLELTDGERLLIERLEGPGETVAGVCREVFLSNFEICQALWAFKLLGLAIECESVPALPVAGFLTEGHFDRDGLAGLLVRLARTGETGVLNIVGSGCERSFHLREGRVVFATSNSIDDGLIAYLLRRGMISLRDREETAKRLLSNKRVGQILLEMGVIEEEELSKLVREHLCEILFDTFRWEEGEWVWVAGDPPTVEGIVLDRSVEDLVFTGLRRVNSWSRVREGCGGHSTRVELTPAYLEILDRMSVATEDWELITMLRTPKTSLELCRASALGDFRVCQTLWALRIIGAVDEAPLDDALEAALGSIGAASAAAGSTDAERPAEDERRPEPEPEPIAPASVAAGEDFEVTTIQEMTPDAPLRDEALPASTWSEPEDERPGPWAWKPTEGNPAVEISAADESAELIKGAWRLSGDELRPPPAPPAPPEALADIESEAAPTETAAFEIVPPPEAGAADGFEMGAPGSGVAALFEIPAPEFSGRQDFELDLPGSRSDDAQVPASPPAEEFSRDAAEPSPQEEPSREFVAEIDDPFADAPPSNDFLDRTVRIPREAVEAALRATPAPGTQPEDYAEGERDGDAEDETAPEPAWDPPAGLDGEIATFVARHKAVFRVIRSEVGAGAVNFVRSCQSALGDEVGELLGLAELHQDGSWDPAELRLLVCERRIPDAAERLRALIDREVSTLRMQIGERRTQALVEQLDGL